MTFDSLLEQVLALVRTHYSTIPTRIRTKSSTSSGADVAHAQSIQHAKVLELSPTGWSMKK
jgi:hypothetical protein